MATSRGIARRVSRTSSALDEKYVPGAEMAPRFLSHWL